MEKITELAPADVHTEIADASAFIDAKIAEVQAMPDGDKGAEFKAAVIDSFKFYKRVITEDVPSVLSVTAGEGDASAKLTRIQDFETKVKTDEEKLDAAVATAQKNFAEANGMQIQE
jgi:hypothetical protein